MSDPEVQQSDTVEDGVQWLTLAEVQQLTGEPIDTIRSRKRYGKYIAGKGFRNGKEVTVIKCVHGVPVMNGVVTPTVVHSQSLFASRPQTVVHGGYAVDGRSNAPLPTVEHPVIDDELDRLKQEVHRLNQSLQTRLDSELSRSADLQQRLDASQAQLMDARLTVARLEAELKQRQELEARLEAQIAQLQAFSDKIESRYQDQIKTMEQTIASQQTTTEVLTNERRVLNFQLQKYRETPVTAESPGGKAPWWRAWFSPPAPPPPSA